MVIGQKLMSLFKIMVSENGKEDHKANLGCQLWGLKYEKYL